MKQRLTTNQKKQRTYKRLSAKKLRNATLIVGVLLSVVGIVPQTKSVEAYHASDCSDVFTSLSSDVIEGVNRNKGDYLIVEEKTGVPWQLLAAIHYRETAFSRSNPANGYGIFQFTPPPEEYEPGPVSDSEFRRQLRYMANRVQNDYVWRGPEIVNKRKLKPNESDIALVKNTLFSYNGRAAVYADQAKHFGYNSTTQPYEGSPYVMNRFDCARARMGIITRDYGTLDGRDARYGAFTIFARLKGESYWKNLVKAGSPKASAYYAINTDRDPNPTLQPGETATLTIRYRNTGTATWYDSQGVELYNKNVNPVYLDTYNPHQRASQFADGWGSCKCRVSRTFSMAYNVDGVPKSEGRWQHRIAPGEYAEFEIDIKVPEDMRPGTYREYFRPVQFRNSSGSFLNMTKSFFDITVEGEAYRATDVYRRMDRNMQSGTTFTNTIRYRNDGLKTWYDQTAVASGNVPTGTKEVRLVAAENTELKQLRDSDFADNWQSCGCKVSNNFSKVYQSDGTTLASNQHSVKPGQIAEYRMNFSIKNSQPAEKYREYFRMIVFQAGSGEDFSKPNGSYFDVTVQETYKNSVVSRKNHGASVKKGRTLKTSITFKNMGNVPWYDRTIAGWDGSKITNSSLPAGTPPVVLSTDRPLNYSSPFGKYWTSRHHRPQNEAFTAVYESDGVTLASNQHTVQPGQIVQFDPLFHVPSGTKSGTYRTYFRPIGWDKQNGSWRIVPMNFPAKNFIDIRVVN